MSLTRDQIPPDIAAAIEAMARGSDAEICLIEPVSSGGNNRAFRVETSRGRFLAKYYFRHSGDKRDRLSSEFFFSTYSSQVVPGYTPRPFMKNDAANVALYEYIEGRPFGVAEITSSEIDQAATFFLGLNAPHVRAQASNLPWASEAAFSISGHVDLIDRRLRDLMSIEPASEEDGRAMSFLSALDAEWVALRDNLEKRSIDLGLLPNAEIGTAQRCISPSDFGFHNALRRPDGSVCFLDFEYAGWDDPARMISDFFTQVAVPVSVEHFDAFADKCLSAFPDSLVLRRRTSILRPIYLVKWCCIAMGVYLPVNMARRKFANPAIDERTVKRRQFETAEKIFLTMRTMSNGLY
jgi:hypothetical protein